MSTCQYTSEGLVPMSVLKKMAQVTDLLQTLCLFTANDFFTFAIPTTLFATFGSLSGTVLTTNPSPSLCLTLCRIPLALAVVWANLLIFDISNQRFPVAVEEDKVNKPHRPIPSGRITCDEARRLLLVLLPLVLGLSSLMGVGEESLLLAAATWLYNDLGGSDENWILRNFLIAVGYGLYSSAALRVMVGPEHEVTTAGVNWILLITLVMFTTQHICDIKDAEGDRLRGRQSAPIVLGDKLVRWSVAVPAMVSSIACPLFFGVGLVAYLFTLAMGSFVAYRTLAYRDLRGDKLTWKLWALWTCSLFALPLIKNPYASLELEVARELYGILEASLVRPVADFNASLSKGAVVSMHLLEL